LKKLVFAESMCRIMLYDRLIGVGVKEVEMEVLGGMMPGDDSFKDENLKKAYNFGRSL